MVPVERMERIKGYEGHAHISGQGHQRKSTEEDHPSSTTHLALSFFLRLANSRNLEHVQNRVAMKNSPAPVDSYSHCFTERFTWNAPKTNAGVAIFSLDL